ECTRSPEVEARGEGTDSEPQGRRLLARPAIDRARIRGIKMIVVFFTLHEIARHPGAREQPDPARTKDIEGYGDRHFVHRTRSVNAIRHYAIGQGFPVAGGRTVFVPFSPIFLIGVHGAGRNTPAGQYLVMEEGAYRIASTHGASVRRLAEIRRGDNADTEATARLVEGLAPGGLKCIGGCFHRCTGGSLILHLRQRFRLVHHTFGWRRRLRLHSIKARHFRWVFLNVDIFGRLLLGITARSRCRNTIIINSGCRRNVSPTCWSISTAPLSVDTHVTLRRTALRGVLPNRLRHLWSVFGTG